MNGNLLNLLIALIDLFEAMCFSLSQLRSATALYLGPEQTFTTSPVKGFTSEVQLTQERNLYQKATVKQFTSEVNGPSLFHNGVHFFHCSYER